jgi:hypothetical protein
VSKSCPENSARIEFQYISKPRVEGISDSGTQCYSSLKFQLRTQPKKREREREREREKVYWKLGIWLKLRTGWIEKEVCCKGLWLELSTGHGLQESFVAMGLD